VRLLNDDRRRDVDLRGAVLQALMLDSVVPSTIDAKVKDGVVTLTGWMPYHYQRNQAEFLAGNVPRVIGLDDQVELTIADPRRPTSGTRSIRPSSAMRGSTPRRSRSTRTRAS
jgi:osmotically-inducible protein OsmY